MELSVLWWSEHTVYFCFQVTSKPEDAYFSSAVWVQWEALKHKLRSPETQSRKFCKCSSCLTPMPPSAAISWEQTLEQHHPVLPSDFQPGQSVHVPRPQDRALSTFMADISAGWSQVPTELMCSAWTSARCDSPCVESDSCPEQWESSPTGVLVWNVQNRPQVITRSDLQKKNQGEPNKTAILKLKSFEKSCLGVLWYVWILICPQMCIWPGTFSAMGSFWLQGGQMAVG